MELAVGTGENMPPVGAEGLSDEEKDSIRQWIVFGAPEEGEVVDTQLLFDYYNVNGVAAFETAPAAPPAGEGFQIKIGPFFLDRAGEEGAEVEYFQKYDLNLPSNVEVNRVDMKIPSYSHHVVMYGYLNEAAANAVAPGLRPSTDHNNLSIITKRRKQSSLPYPEGTAFIWDLFFQ